MFFKKPIAEVNIQFYDNPKDTLSKSTVSVVYTNTEANIKTITQHFLAYMGKIIYNLGQAPEASMLYNVISIAVSNEEIENINVMVGENYELEFIEESSKNTKFCNGKFYSNGAVATKFSFGGENYYAPMSVIAFFQFIMEKVKDEQKKRFIEGIKEALA